jgi:protein-tyrosine phosphatase
MLDLHSHILPGLDDGARTVEDSCELARAASGEGIRVIAATPHVRADYPTTADAMERGVAELRRTLAWQRIPVEVLQGGELDLDFLRTRLTPDDAAQFALAGRGRHLLLEFPYGGWPLALEQTVFELRVAGLTPVLAHPERNKEVQGRPERLEKLVRAGALVQVTAASVDGRLGRSSRAAAGRLLELGLVHLLASDAHPPDIRSVGFAGAIEALGDRGLVRYLTEDAPAAIAAGETPRRPPALTRRRRLRLWPASR